MRLSQYESEGHNEERLSLIVADMKNPVTPILEAALDSVINAFNDLLATKCGG